MPCNHPTSCNDEAWTAWRAYADLRNPQISPGACGRLLGSSCPGVRAKALLRAGQVGVSPGLLSLVIGVEGKLKAAAKQAAATPGASEIFQGLWDTWEAGDVELWRASIRIVGATPIQDLDTASLAHEALRQGVHDCIVLQSIIDGECPIEWAVSWENGGQHQ